MVEDRVCFFNSSRTWGGGEKWHFDSSLSLKEDGEPVLLVSNPGSELSRKAAAAGIPLHQITINKASFLNPFKIYTIAKLLRRQRVAKIILNLPADLKAAGIAAKLAGVREIIYRRGSAIPIRNSFLNRFLFRRVVTGIIANSEETKRTVLARNSRLFPADRIKVIYNGIDLKAFDSLRVRSVYSRRPGEIVLGHVGRLSYEKNQKFLIEVVGDLKTRGLDCTLLIAGKGDLEQELKAFARAKGVEKEVVFLGFREDVRSFMADIDIFLLSSLWEGFGYVLVEAMAAGKPVVAFNASSTPEIVHDGQTGLLVPPQQREEFVAAILRLAADPDLRAALGRAGRQRVEKVFSQDRAREQLRELLVLK